MVTNVNYQSLTIKEKADVNVTFLQANENVCPAIEILASIGDRWGLITIMTLGRNQRLRFNEMRHGIPGISQRMLTIALRHLEENGLVTRTVFPEVPPRVEYELTALGNGFLEKITDLTHWLHGNLEEIVKARDVYSGRSRSTKKSGSLSSIGT